MKFVEPLTNHLSSLHFNYFLFGNYISVLNYFPKNIIWVVCLIKRSANLIALCCSILSSCSGVG